MTDEIAAPVAAPEISANVQPDAGASAVSTADPVIEPVIEPDDFDENLIPETSRDNFRKYRESQKAKQADWEKRNNDTLRESYEAKARAQQYERQLAAMQKPVDAKDIGEMPKLDDPDIKTVEDYTKAIVAWAQKKGAMEFQQRQSTAQQQQQSAARAAQLAAKGHSAMQAYPDFRQVTESLIPIADSIPELQQFVGESEKGADVFYHLCKNPALLDGLMKMTPFARNKELIRLEGAISTIPVKNQTKAPAPMTPVGSGSGNVTRLIDLAAKDNVDDFVARANREELRKRKGLN